MLVPLRLLEIATLHLLKVDDLSELLLLLEKALKMLVVLLIIRLDRLGFDFRSFGLFVLTKTAA